MVNRGRNDKRYGNNQEKGRSKSRDYKFKKNSISHLPARTASHLKRDCPKRKEGNKPNKEMLLRIKNPRF